MKFALVAALALLTAACADTPAPKTASHRGHVSPEAVPAPPPPPGGFDLAKATALVDEARAQRQAGHLVEAGQAAQRAIDLWPAQTAAWTELAASCGDQRCAAYAAFFLAKLDFAQGLPDRALALGFQNIVEDDVGTQAGSFTYDQAAIDMARRLWAFYGRTGSVETVTSREKTWGEEHPFTSMTVIGGAVAGILTGIKSAAK